MTAAAIACTGQDALDARAALSPFRELIGLRVVEWGPGVCMVEIPLRHSLTNFSGSVAGPVVAAAIDMAATLSGCYKPSPQPTLRAITLSFTVSFVATASEGAIRARAVMAGGGKQVFTSTVTVTDSAGRTIATGQGTFRYVSLRETA